MSPLVRVHLGVSFAFLLVFACPVVAGDLNPPVGPVGPTMKTLSEVEPRIAVNATNTPGDAYFLYIISQPGSYYLTGNVVETAGQSAIFINASNVTLDLNGFEITGNSGSSMAISGTFSPAERVTIRNGVVRGLWNPAAINLAAVSQAIVESVTVAGTLSGYGIYVGPKSTVRNCTVSGCQVGGGIQAGDNCTLLDCLAVANEQDGINAFFGTRVIGCTVADNLGNGIVVNSRSLVRECVATDNGSSGVWVFGDDSTVLSSTCAGNLGPGILVGSNCTVGHCAASSNSGGGIAVGFGTLVSKCTASENALNGIARFVVPGGGFSVTDCVARGNQADGIQVSNDCTVLDSFCTGNGNGGDGAGIHVLGSDCRIEGNNLTDNDRGIDVDAAGNIIIRNTCSGNTTNWDIAANNVYGPILDRTAPASPAVSGNSAASSLGSTDPNANYTY